MHEEEEVRSGKAEDLSIWHWYTVVFIKTQLTRFK